MSTAINVFLRMAINRRVPEGTMYVLEEAGEICVSMILNREQGCRVMRIDTHAENEPAKKLYRKNGFRIVGYGESLLEGLIPEKQVFLECNLEA